MADDKTPATPTREPQTGPGQLDAGGTQVTAVAQNKELGVAYQSAGQVRQALAELRNARAHGNDERVKAATKVLEAQGFDLDAWEARQKRSTPGDKSVDARKRPPEGRSATPPGQVRTDAPSPPPPPAAEPLAPGVSIPPATSAKPAGQTTTSPAGGSTTVTTTTDVTSKPAPDSPPKPAAK